MKRQAFNQHFKDKVQLTIFDQPTLRIFDGQGLDKKDHERLSTQFERVFKMMSDGEWHTLRELQAVCGGSECGISARIRDFKKSKFGGHTVLNRKRSQRTWEYRLIIKNN